MGDGSGDVSSYIRNQVNVSGTSKDATRLNLTGVSSQNISGLNIDGVAPTVTGVTSTTGNDSYKQGETIAITVAFSEVVNVTGTPQLTLETGGSDAVVDYSSGTGSNTLTFNYTIGSGETSSDLDYECD